MSVSCGGEYNGLCGVDLIAPGKQGAPATRLACIESTDFQH